MLTGHKSCISGIIRLNNREIVSGEWNGELMIWDIDQGLCIRQIPRLSIYCEFLTQMKQHIRGDLLLSCHMNVKVWSSAKDLGNTPTKQFDVKGRSIEFLSGDLLLRGGKEGQLEFINYAQAGCNLPPIITGLHSDNIQALQRIAKNIVITAAYDGYLKVIHPISRKCYLNFKARKSIYTLAYFY